MTTEDLDLIGSLEKRRTQAMTSGDWTSLEQILGDDLMYGHSNGSIDTKASMLAMLRSGKLSYLEIEPRIENAIRITRDVIAATGLLRTTASIGGVEKRLLGRYLCVWGETKAGWRLQALQGTDRGAG